MKKSLFKIVLISLTFFIGSSVFAQKGAKLYEELAYAEAIESYERAIKNGDRSVQSLQNLADSYYYNGMYKDANRWYSEIVNNERNLNSLSVDLYYRYIQTLKSVGNYQEADKLMDEIADKYKNDNRVKLYKSNKKYLENIKSNSGAFTISLMDKVNTPGSEYGATMYKGHIIFASSKDRASYHQRIHTWTNDPFTKLYAAPVYIDGYVGEAKPFAKKIEGKYNESTPVFTLDGQTMYFSSNEREAKKTENYDFVNLYKASLVNGKWSNVEKLPFNVSGSITAHPALSPDGNWLYFVSDRDKGYGQSDLYRVEILKSGGFGIIENLGDKINTEGRESFPFISTNNVLYFASDGHPGLGGFDIYAVQINDDNTFGEVVNLGESVNSSYDDFAFYLDPNCKYGYMTSNREGGVGKDDLYFVREIEGIDLNFYQSIIGNVYNMATNQGINNAKVSLYDHHHNLVEEVLTNAKGEYIFKEKLCYIGYTIGVNADSYNTIELGLPEINKQNEAKLDFGLEGGDNETLKFEGQPISKGDDLFKILKMQPIYFDFGKAIIRPDAERELYKIVKVMNEYPNMRVDVRSHTDSRGNDSFNYTLSQKRAQATVDWLVSKGISRNRLTGRGFGGSVLLNECTKGVVCSESQHQQNRRSEFIIEDL